MPQKYKGSLETTVNNSVQLSCVWLFAIPWAVAHQASLSITTPRACSNLCPSSWWCHPAISSSAIPFSSCPQSFPVTGSLPMSQLFTSGGQSVETSTSASVLPVNIQGWFPLGLIVLLSLLSKELSRVFFSTTIQSITSLAFCFLYGPTLTSVHETGKTIALTT